MPENIHIFYKTCPESDEDNILDTVHLSSFVPVFFPVKFKVIGHSCLFTDHFS